MKRFGFFPILSLVMMLALVHVALAQKPEVRSYGLPGEGLEFRLETGAHSDKACLHLLRWNTQGYQELLVQPIRLQRDSKAANDFQGLAMAQGKLFRVRVSLSQDGKTLDWQSPEKLPLADGSHVQLAGSRGLLTQDQLMAEAREHFTRADKELNRVYGLLRKSLPPKVFAELLQNQLQWLKYRDDAVVDGDKSKDVGPGSLSFILAQTTRTLDRIRFLEALSRPTSGKAYPDGLYSDGLGREMVVDASPKGKARFIVLQTSRPQVHALGLKAPVAIFGRATPEKGQGVWQVKVDTKLGQAKNANVKGLTLNVAPDGSSMQVDCPSNKTFSTRLYSMGAPAPAMQSMRRILLRLPAAVFDNTTEGISEKDKTLLAEKGAGALYKLVKEGSDYLCIGYSEGKVEMLRFPGRDGSAVIAVVTNNGQANGLELWRIPLDGSAPKTLPLDQAFARLADGTPSPYPDPNSPKVDFLSYSLNPGKAQLQIHWEPLAEGEASHPWPDEEKQQTLSLIWDGYAFWPADWNPPVKAGPRAKDESKKTTSRAEQAHDAGASSGGGHSN